MTHDTPHTGWSPWRLIIYVTCGLALWACIGWGISAAVQWLAGAWL